MGSNLFRTRRRLAILAALVAAACDGPGGGCFLGPCGPTPEECQAANKTRAWQIDLRGAELLVGDSRRVSVTPGFGSECYNTIRVVDWTVDNAAVASLTPLGAKNPVDDIPVDVARAWLTALGPGEAAVGARLSFSDGSTRDAQPAVARVVAPERPSRRSRVIAEGTVDVTFNQSYTSVPPFPFAVPGAGLLDVVVDWTDFSSTFSFSVYEGQCLALPCGGRRIVDGSSVRHVKPRRESGRVDGGDATLAMSGIGRGTATVRYEVRFTPD